MESASMPRRASVERLSTREELVQIIRVAAAIVLAVWIYLAAALGDAGATRRDLLPYQTLIQNRPPAAQRIFREMQEGLLEAEGARSTTGSWPTAAALAEQGIPPFVRDPTDKTANFNWQLIREGTFINYLGIPDRAGVPAWLLLVQEPDAGVPPDQPYEDEQHHRLLDGTMLHVSTWSYSDGLRVPEKVVRLPQNEGWTEVFAVGPARPRDASIITP
jgi:hypothetical protein